MKKLLIVVIAALVAVLVIYKLVLFPGLKWFVPEDESFMVLLPGKPTKLEQPVKGSGGATLPATQVEFRLNKFIVEHDAGYVELNVSADEMRQMNPTTMLNEAVKGGVQAISGRLISSTDINLDGYPGKEAMVDTNNLIKGRARMRLYLVENRMYMIVVVGAESYVNSRYSQQILDSFQLVK